MVFYTVKTKTLSGCNVIEQNIFNIFQNIFWPVPEEEEEDDEDEPEDEEETGSFSFSDVETDESKKEEESLSYHSPYEIPSGKKRIFFVVSDTFC